MSCGLRIVTGLHCLSVLEHPWAYQMYMVIYRVWGSCAHAYDIIITHVLMTSFIITIVSNIMLGQILSVSCQDDLFYFNNIIFWDHIFYIRNMSLFTPRCQHDFNLVSFNGNSVIVTNIYRFKGPALWYSINAESSVFTFEVK